MGRATADAVSGRELPLARVRVLDLGAAESDGASRLFADLGADVLKIEPPGGSPARAEAPVLAGVSIPYTLNNANKRSTVLDPSDPVDRQRFDDLAAAADIVVDGGIPGGAAAFGTSAAQLADRFGHLVALQLTDFGTAGPRATWQATDPVLYALSTALSRSGPTTGTPALPPNGIASATAATQAAWAALTAYFHRLRYGAGDYIDASRLEAVLQSLDPPFGSQGQAASGRKSSAELWRGRPRNQNIYPIFDCADGHVRICLLSPRQWHGMRGWLGEPARFQDPEFDTIAARYAASADLIAAIGALFADQTMDELVIEGQRRGVPIAAVAGPTQALTSQHFRAVGALTDIEVTPGMRVSAPTGPFVVDGRRAGLRDPAPAADGAPEWAHAGTGSTPTRADAGSAPFDGLRIIDLGVIVAGGELGRLFADLGAEVIKIESTAYPDGLRQTPPGMAMSKSWALTHRNQCSLGLDLRRPEGAELFTQLVSGADAVFANFKPGTLAALGFPYERLRELNPRIVLAESSAFGAAGPWSSRMGYGPLVRAATGVTRLWATEDPDTGDPSFFDATTVFPDHLVARVTAVAALAALIGRELGGSGAHVHISQAETAVNALASTYLAEAARAGGLPVEEHAGVHGVYPCAGSDEWCVISLRSDDDRGRLAALIGTENLPARRDDLTAAVARWTAGLDNHTVAERCQRAGIPAAPMHRAADVLTDPQVTHRSLFTDMVHPLFEVPMPTETRPALYRRIPPAPLRPAPTPGEQTREVCHRVLGLDHGEIERLIDDGVLFTTAAEPGH